MGGSSAVNYMVYMRGNRRDYDSWAEAGNHGWSYRQFGFRRNKSTSDLLVYATLQKHGKAFAVSLEKAKAFDRCTSHIAKILSYGMPVDLCNWISDFLRDISIRVVVDGTSSDSLGISWVLKYFKKMENNRGIEAQDKVFHSVGGPLNVERFPYTDVNTMMIVEGFREMGLPVTDFNGENQIGTDISQSTSLNGQRFSANRAYIRPVRHRPNLHIVTHAFVTKILIEPETKMAYGVIFDRDGIHHTVLARKEVILSAGSLNSPKILMLSGIGPKEHLESLHIPVIKSLHVGHNLQDHATSDGIILGFSNKTSTLISNEEIMGEVYNYHQQGPLKKGPLSTTTTLNAIAFIKTPFALEDAPDIQFHFDGKNVEEFYSDPRTFLASNIYPLSFYDGVTTRVLLLTPKSRGVLLLNDTDPVYGQPLIYTGFFTAQQDIDTLLFATKYVIGLEHTEAFKLSGAEFIKDPLIGCEAYPWGSDEYFICIYTHYTATIYHPVGTCKMGPHWDHHAVVDPRLRVYGVKHLRVIDSSIMPLIVRGNTNVPTLMIGEKGSDMIKEEWLSS